MQMENRDLLSLCSINKTLKLTHVRILPTDGANYSVNQTEIRGKKKHVCLWTFPLSQNKNIKPYLDVSHTTEEVVAEANISLETSFTCWRHFLSLPSNKTASAELIWQYFRVFFCFFLLSTRLTPRWRFTEIWPKFKHDETLSHSWHHFWKESSLALFFSLDLFFCTSASAPAKHSLSAKVAAATSGSSEATLDSRATHRRWLSRLQPQPPGKKERED